MTQLHVNLHIKIVYLNDFLFVSKRLLTGRKISTEKDAVEVRLHNALRCVIYQNNYTFKGCAPLSVWSPKGFWLLVRLRLLDQGV